MRRERFRISRTNYIKQRRTSRRIVQSAVPRATRMIHPMRKLGARESVNKLSGPRHRDRELHHRVHHGRYSRCFFFSPFSPAFLTFFATKLAFSPQLSFFRQTPSLFRQTPSLFRHNFAPFLMFTSQQQLASPKRANIFRRNVHRDVRPPVPTHPDPARHPPPTRPATPPRPGPPPPPPTRPRPGPPPTPLLRLAPGAAPGARSCTTSTAL